MLENLDMTLVYHIFGGHESYEKWFKATLRDELERRQMAMVREEANRVLQQSLVVLPPELM